MFRSPTAARHLTAELMDAPELSEADHRAALVGLRRINTLSHAAETMLPAVIRFASERGLKKLRWIDVATGGGDVPIALANAIYERGIDFDLTFFDISDRALDYAAKSAKDAGHEVRTISGDATARLPDERFDLVTSSLFLHHLTDTAAVATLKNLAAATDGLLLLSDLRRSMLGLVAAHLTCRLITTSTVVHVDGPASVRGAWTSDELLALARQAGLTSAVVHKQWPLRQLLVWQRDVTVG